MQKTVTPLPCQRSVPKRLVRFWINIHLLRGNFVRYQKYTRWTSGQMRPVILFFKHFLRGFLGVEHGGEPHRITDMQGAKVPYRRMSVSLSMAREEI